MEEKDNELLCRSMGALIDKTKRTDIFKEKLSGILDMQMPSDYHEKLRQNGIIFQNGDIADAVSAAMVLQALNGNIAAYVTIRDTMGYKPVENVKNDVVVRIDMPPQAKELGE